MSSLLRTRPALRFALALAFGVGAGGELMLPAPATFAGLAAAFAMTLAALALNRRAIAGVLLSLTVAALGAVLIALRISSWESALLLPTPGADELHVTGVVLDEPARSAAQIRFVLHAEALEFGGRALEERRRIMVRLRHADSAQGTIRPGSVVAVSGVLEPLARRRNPGERDQALFSLVNDITASILADGAHARTVERQGGGFSAVLGSVRRSLSDVIERHHEGDVRSYLKGIVLALRGEMSQTQREAFLVSGTFHVIAVSGLHIGLIALMLHSLFALLRFGAKFCALAAMGGLAAYMLLVGWTPSVVRAVIMACVVLGGRLVERPVDVLQSTGAAASCVLLFDPAQLFDPGFQLSFGAVLAIASLAPPWIAWTKKFAGRALPGKAARACLQLVVVSLAAQAGTVPITALQFERISIVSVAANVLVVPLSSLNVALGTVTVGCGLVAHELAAPYAALNELLAVAVLESARLAASMPASSISTAGWSAAEAFALGAGLVALLSLPRPALMKRSATIALALLNLSLAADLAQRPAPPLTVTALDVGEGEAIVVETGDGGAMLIDGGPAAPAYDTGKRVIVPFLERRGISRLDALLVTHAHGDHLGGAPEVLEALSVSRLFVSPQIGSSPEAQKLFEAARRRGTAVDTLSRGSVLGIGRSVRLFVLHPGPEGRAGGNLNNTSIVCKLVIGSCSILLAGDIEADVEAELVRRYGPLLRSDVLKVAHHGSSTSSCGAFLEAVGARTALISVGWRNRFGHPSTAVLADLERRGVRTLRTDRDGALVVSSDGRQIGVVDWRDP